MPQLHMKLRLYANIVPMSVMQCVVSTQKKTAREIQYPERSYGQTDRQTDGQTHGRKDGR